MSSSKVRVAVRVRPFNRREIELGTKCCIDMDGHQTILFPANCKGSERKSPKTFAFDHCFWSVDESKKKNHAGQAQVFDCIGKDILENAFEGYNACIFAYGQTGSGKSYSMMGTHENKGLIPRLCDCLFESMANNDDPGLSFKVEVSYMEIYNEKVRDLLDPKGGKTNLKVREHKIYGPYVDGLSTLAVSSFEDIESLMMEGNKSRTVAATNMNAESSRSHAVFNVTLTQTLTDLESEVSGEKVSKLSLVDLAGSERAQKSGATGERLKEGSNINKSLTTLGLVISALADQSGKTKQKFVPYRDSVLTWLLKECLGGNSKTVMCATISPAADNFDETLSTLRYADRAKRIVNHAVINEDPNARIIRELRDEVDTLKKQLKVAESLKADTLKERLIESEKLMTEMTLTWEEKLQNTEKIIKENQQALEKMGISVQTSGIKVEKDRCFLVNLNADPALNELLVYYLKDHTLVGRPDAPANPDIQLSGLGILPEHCVIDIDNEYEVYLTPMANARTCVNGSVIENKTALRHGDRILWGNNHFFRINCPRPPGAGSSGANTPESEVPADFDFAQSEVVMKELSNDPIQNAMKTLENQHKEDKDKALERQKDMYERQLEMLRNKLTPNQRQQLDRFDIAQLSPQSGNPNAINMQTRYQQWEEERDDVFRQSLSKLREEVVKANALVREANFLAEEMGKQTEFHVTLQIPASNLTPNRKRGAIVSEPAIQVKRKGKGTQIWAMEKLENKIIDMRDMYEDRKERGLPLKDTGVPISGDPFYETQENHNLIGVANIFLEVLFHDVKLAYAVPIINQQGEVSGRLNIELQRISGPLLDRSPDSDTSNESSGYEVLGGDIEPEGLSLGSQLTCRLRISQASGLPPNLANFVFCQYTFWGEEDSCVVPPIVKQVTTRRKIPEYSMKFDHTREYTVNVTEEFIEHALDGSLAIEVWGHRSTGFDTKPTGWEIDSLHAKSRSLADRWGELTRKIELWLEVLELNEQGEYCPVECQMRPEVLTGGVFQLRQGHSRRICVKVRPVHDSGTLPLVCEAITGISVGSICARSRLQKGLDSYQDEDLTRLREKWSEALMRRREYLDEQIHKIINKSEKNDHDVEREASLINQWVSLTEERNAVLVPAPQSGIPGAPADWNPPSGMETHIPVLFLDLNTDEMGSTCLLEGSQAAGVNSILPKEHGTKFYNLPIVKYCDKDVSAVASWDSSIHDSIHLNRVTGHNERVYLIVKVVARLSHPAAMEMVIRKRISVNIYKKQSFGSALRKKLARADPVYACGVTYEVVSNIPKASEDPEDRESLALMAASGADEGGTADGETYIEKYTKGVSAVESILALDRLRQEVVIKEKLTAQGRPLRKTASVPNIQGALSRTIDPRFDNFDEDFRMSKSESLHSQLNSSQQSLPGSPYGNPGSPYGNPGSPYGYYAHSPQQPPESLLFFRRPKSDSFEAPFMYSSLGSLHNPGSLNSPGSPGMPPFGMSPFGIHASSPKSISASPGKYSHHHHLGSVKEEKSKELSHTDSSNLIDLLETKQEEEKSLSPNAILIPVKSPSHRRSPNLQQTPTNSSESGPREDTDPSSMQKNFALSMENDSNPAFAPLSKLSLSDQPENIAAKTVVSSTHSEMTSFTSSNFNEDKQRPLSTVSSGYSSNLTLAEDSLSIRSVDEGPDFTQHSHAAGHDLNHRSHAEWTDIIQQNLTEQRSQDDETTSHDLFFNETIESSRENSPRDQDVSELTDTLTEHQFVEGLMKGNVTSEKNERNDKSSPDEKISENQGKGDENCNVSEGDTVTPRNEDKKCENVSDKGIETILVVIETDAAKRSGDGEENECGGDGADNDDENLSGFEPLIIIEDDERDDGKSHDDVFTSDQDTKKSTTQVDVTREKLAVPEFVETRYSDMDVGGDERLSVTDSEKSDHHGNSGVQEDLSDGDDSLSVCSFDSRHESERINAPLPKWLKVGERVDIGSSRTGTVKFIGNTAFKSGTWIGVMLDAATGKNNGSVDGVHYFRCPPKHGVFVRADKLTQSKKPLPSKSRSIPSSKVTGSGSPHSSKGSSPVGSPVTGKFYGISKNTSPHSSKGSSPVGSPKTSKNGKK